MKKLKTSLIVSTKISLIFLVFFIFSPSLKIHAMFSDTANVNVGIKLELGTISLASKNTTNNEVVNFTEGDPVLISDSTLINEGSLKGKLAYKIKVTKENGLELTAEELQDMSIIINFDTLANEVTAEAISLNTDSYTFVNDSNSNDIIVEPDSIGKIPVKVKYKSSAPTKDEKLKITVLFRLIQSNAADANAEMFSDEEVLTNTVTLVPKIIEEESYWPAASTFSNKSSNNKIIYSLEKMAMVFSEVYNPNSYSINEIKNLNKAVLYIQLPKEEDLKTTDYTTGKQIDKYKLYSTTANGKGKINVDKIELDEIHHGYKVTFSLIDSYDTSDPNKVREYTNKFNYQLHQTFQLHRYTFDGWNKGNYNHYADINLNKDDFASRLVLSTDMTTEANAAHFTKRVIPLSVDKKDIVIKQLKTMSGDWVENVNFKDVPLINETVALEVKGGKSGQIYSLLNPDKTFSLWLNSNETLNNAVLNVKILGDTGNTLVISRTLINGTSPSSNKSTTGSTTQSSSRRSMSVPLVVEEIEEPTEQVTDSKESVEETNSTTDSLVVDESAVETPIEESDEEELIDETEVTEEVVDSSSADSSVEQIE